MSPEGARVLIVDDSPYIRQTLRAMAERSIPVSGVDLAGNGRTALAKALKNPPDVVLLDLDMPVMDGFTFLRFFRPKSRAPVLVVSSYLELANVEKALELGATGFISKPHNPYRELSGIEEELRLKLRQHLELPAGVRVARRRETRETHPRPPAADFPVVAIGSSSGGPSTIQYLLSSLPAQMAAAVLIAQHMPPGFTETFARRLCNLLPAEVHEATDGEPIVPGEILVAPGGKHLVVCGTGSAARTALLPAEDSLWAPSVDRLFQTAAQAFGERLTAFVLTGMGKDGSAGVRAVKEHGGRVFAESEETAAIFGMPREAAATGCVDEVLPLPEIAVRLIRLVSSR